MRRAISPFLLLLCAFSAQAGHLFLGPIPVPFTPARSTVVLDLHRFYQPSDTSKFEVGSAPGVQTSFDRSTLQLQVSLETSARGLIDLPFKISEGGKMKEGVITVAFLKGEGDQAGGDLSIYADQLTKEGLTVRAAGTGTAHSVSAVAELPDGSSRLLAAKVKANEVFVSADGLPNGAWLRVIAVDEEGRPSNVVRCSLGESVAFRWQDAIMYYALTDRFADGDKSNNHSVANPEVKPPANFHGGDWRGSRRKSRTATSRNSVSTPSGLLL